MGRGIDFYKGTGFCEVLGMITEAGAGSFTIVPNWRCNGNVSSAGAAVDLRAVSPLENQYAVAMRSRFSNMAVVADGIRKSSTGQLYMAGCLGIVDSEGNTCNSRICLYIPLSFSIKQHGIIFGSFSGAGMSGLWNILSESMDLEAGLDCLTGAIVSYPPITALWLANPAARISISGIGMKMIPSILARPPLTTGAEALLQRKPSESYESSSYYLEKNQWLNGIDYVVKIPVMALSEGVEISIRLLTRSPCELHLFPSEKWVLLLACLTVHVTGM
ncbi:DUF2921 domain-containing protein [Salix suchowensis]|nr:DUF2921 domain-containing protein [Salix suchowensis]